MPTSPPAPPVRLGPLFGLAVAILSVLQGLGSLVYPYGRDQGNYAYAGWIWWDGGALYRDVYVFKPPLTAVVHGIAIGLFGVNMLSIRYVDLAWHAVVSVLVAAILHEWTRDRWVSALGGVLYAFFYWQVEYWDTSQTDGFLNLPALLGVWLAMRGVAAWNAGRVREAVAWWGGVGLSLAMAIGFKYTAVVIVLPLLVGVAIYAERRWIALLTVTGMTATGGVVGISLLAAWLWLDGGWQAFWDVQFNVMPTYVSAIGEKFGFVGSINQFFYIMWLRYTLRPALFGLMVLPIPVVSRLVFGTPDERRALLASLAWLTAGFAAVFLQGRFHTYHYLMLYPAIGALLAQGVLPWLVAVVRLAREDWQRIAIAGVLAAILTPSLLYASRIPGHQSRLWRVVFTDQTLEQHWAKDPRYDQRDYDTGDILGLTHFLVPNTTPDDRVFVWGFDPTIHIVAQRKGVSRFLYNYPFRVPNPSPIYKAELMGALEAAPPKYVVVGSRDGTSKVAGISLDSKRMVGKFKALNEFLRERYTLDRTIARYDVYRRKDP